MNVVFPRGIAVDEANASGEHQPHATLLEPCTSTTLTPPTTLSDSLVHKTPERLAQLSQAGCADSFEELVSRFEIQIFNFLRQFTQNVHDAEDLTQETFLKAYRNLPRYKPTLGFAPWLFTIARRTAASHFRALRHFEELPPEKEGSEETPATALEQKDETTSLWKIVRSLKARQAEAIWLRYAEGFSVEEIARIMQTNRVYVKVLLHRARTSLSKVLSARRPRPGASVNSKETMKELL